MILPPFSVPKDFKDALYPQGEKELYWFIFTDDQLLVCNNKRGLPKDCFLELKRSLYMGTLGDRHVFAGEVKPKCPAPKGWHFAPLRELHNLIDEEHYAIAGRAMQLIHWDRVNKHCGCCGNFTFIRENERCRECKLCGHLAYPKLAPAVMALVKRDERILLARSPHFPAKFYSVLAGYLDPGETLEQCVTREVFEEVGIKVSNVRYFGSQPWPFSYSLMVGFTCSWEEGELKVDKNEIEDAGWFDAPNLPKLPPHLSLARMLIDSHLT